MGFVSPARRGNHSNCVPARQLGVPEACVGWHAGEFCFLSPVWAGSALLVRAVRCVGVSLEGASVVRYKGAEPVACFGALCSRLGAVESPSG